MRALAFEHLRPNPIGVYGDVLDRRGIEVERVRLDAGEAIPDWRAYDFLVVMGAAASVWDHDEHPWIAAEQQTIREAVLAGIPYFGVCYGAQLLASAFGARSYRGTEAELGLNQVFLTASSRSTPRWRACMGSSSRAPTIRAESSGRRARSTSRPRPAWDGS